MSEDFGYAPRHSAHQGQHRVPASRVSNWPRDIAGVILVALICAAVIKHFIFQPFYIPSASMENTLQNDDRIIVARWVPEHSPLRRGDIVVFKDPGGWLQLDVPRTNGLQAAVQGFLVTVGLLPETATNHLIKRVIGVGGDHVVCCNPNGLLMINGAAITETYLKPGSIASEVEFDVIVPQGYLWVMGDNRQHSGDSREHMGSPGGGFVPLSDVVGRASLRIWPLDRAGGFGDVSGVFAAVPPGDGAGGAND